MNRLLSFGNFSGMTAQGAFTNYVCIQGWVGGQQNAYKEQLGTTVKVQTRVKKCQKMQTSFVYAPFVKEAKTWDTEQIFIRKFGHKCLFRYRYLLLNITSEL